MNQGQHTGEWTVHSVTHASLKMKVSPTPSDTLVAVMKRANLEDFEEKMVTQRNRMYTREDVKEWDFKKTGMVSLEVTEIYKSVRGHFNGVSIHS